MKLYYLRGSCSLNVRIVLHELGLKAEYISVDRATKKTEKGEDFKAINIKAQVPTLVLDNGEILTENAVIQQYLVDTHQATHLLPACGQFQRYRVLEWLNYITTELHKGFGPLFHPAIPEEVKQTVFRALLTAKLKFVDAHLSKQAYLLGTELTLPDFYLFTVLSWMPRVNLNIDEHPHLKQYFEKLKQRPSVKRALEEEGLI